VGRIDGREVEFADPVRTTSGESASRELARRQRTKAGVSTMIRHRFSPGHKLCRLVLCRDGSIGFAVLICGVAPK